MKDEAPGVLKAAWLIAMVTIALRYPRGNGLGVEMDAEMKALPIGSWEVLREGNDAVILTFGTTISLAMNAAETMAARGVEVRVVNARFIKPMDEAMLHEIMKENLPILTIEESMLQGGFGSAVLEFAFDHNYRNVQLERMGIPDEFIEHGEVDLLLAEIHMTADEAVKRLEQLVPKTQSGRV